MWFDLKSFISRSGKRIKAGHAEKFVGQSGATYYKYIAGDEVGILLEEYATERMEAERIAGKIKPSADQNALNCRFNSYTNFE